MSVWGPVAHKRDYGAGLEVRVILILLRQVTQGFPVSETAPSFPHLLSLDTGSLDLLCVGSDLFVQY